MRKKISIMLVGAVVLSSLGAACTKQPTYACASNDACVSEQGKGGICEPNGFCSFVDAACVTSSRRYADGAGSGLAAACVPVDAAQDCIQQLSMGVQYGCLIAADGSAWCWGINDNGQLGDGTTTNQMSPTKVKLPAGVKVAAIGTGESHTCALDATGGVWCWGGNDTHQLAGEDASKTPVKVTLQTTDTPPKPLIAKALSVGGKHACALVEGGAVYCWGENSSAQCGQDPAAFDDVKVPTLVAGIDGLESVSVGDEFSCALKDD